MLHAPFKRLFVTILPVLLMTMQLLPNTASVQPGFNPASPALNREISPLSSSQDFRLYLSFKMFGHSVTVVDITITREQSEQFELLSEQTECQAEIQPIACANLILSDAQANTSGVLSELIRLTKIFGNSTLCLEVPNVENPACVSGGQEVLREMIFGPPPVSSGTPQPSGQTQIPGIEPFVGTWGVAGMSVLTINAYGSASYAARDVRALVQFSRVQGNTLYGTVTIGTVMSIAPQGNSIQTGGDISVTLTNSHDVQVSNGDMLCQPSDQCAY